MRDAGGFLSAAAVFARFFSDEELMRESVITALGVLPENLHVQDIQRVERSQRGFCRFYIWGVSRN